MRYVVAIVSGALLAGLPPYMLTFGDYAWQHACMSTTMALPTTDALGKPVEDPCWLIDETLHPLPVRLLMLGMLAIGCAMGGALAARVSETRRMVVAFLAPFVAYVVLFALSGPDASLLPVAVGIALVAGTLGAVGAGCRRLTNTWSATRAKPRAPL